MARMIFVNLPVRDLGRSISFYRAVGAEQIPQFSNKSAAMMSFSREINVMLLTHSRFADFCSKPVPDARASAQVLLCLSADARTAVDEIAESAAASGAVLDPTPRQDTDFMYGRSFEDPDGHIWEVMWMDQSALSCGEDEAIEAETAAA